MYAIELDNQDTITLDVTDVERSQHFYQDLLGLSAGSGQQNDAELAGLSSETRDMRLQLRQRRVGSPIQSLWLSVEVDTVTDVLDLYLLAIILGSRALLPRKRGDRWNTVVTDPDGHRVSIWTHVPREAPGRDAGAPTQVRRSPRLEWEKTQRHGDDASDRRSAQNTQQENTASLFGRGAEGADIGISNPSAGRDTTPAN
jgi:hypothetical protein